MSEFFLPSFEFVPKKAKEVIIQYGAETLFYKDVPINDEYKIDAKEENIDKIILSIKDLLDNYDKKIKDYEEYRDTVLNLENNFIKQIIINIFLNNKVEDW